MSAVSGGMLAALGAMPPLGGLPARSSSSSMAAKSPVTVDKGAGVPNIFLVIWHMLLLRRVGGPPLAWRNEIMTNCSEMSLVTHSFGIAGIALGAAVGAAGKKESGLDGGAGGSASKATRDPSKLCKCKKSKCVRQYCVCFRAGLLCEGCECAECLNDGKHEVERLAAIEHIKTSDPLAFVDKIRPEV